MPAAAVALQEPDEWLVNNVGNPVAHAGSAGTGASTTVGVVIRRWNTTTKATIAGAAALALLVCAWVAFRGLESGSGTRPSPGKEVLLHTVKSGSGWPP
jgi:hypothetical protein